MEAVCRLRSKADGKKGRRLCSEKQGLRPFVCKQAIYEISVPSRPSLSSANIFCSGSVRLRASSSADI